MLINNKENDELRACSFHNWYDNFEKISIPSQYLKIPPAVIEYLREDLFILPGDCFPNNVNDHGFDWDDSEIIEQPQFPEFSKAIKDTIKDLSGAVFLKTNWHSPKDAFWITTGQTTKVQDITDVYQLLKASNIVKQDLNNQNISKSEDEVDDYVLVLKKWKEIHPSTEYRCFVRNRKLIAISHREWPQFHSHILDQHSDIINDIASVFMEKIKFQFPLPDFVFDVVRSRKDQVFVLDFSPFNQKFTNGLAFEWDQLNSENFNKDDNSDDDNPAFRYLLEDCGIQPNSRNNYGIPQDILDMFSNTAISNDLGTIISQIQEERIQQDNEETCCFTDK